MHDRGIVMTRCLPPPRTERSFSPNDVNPISMHSMIRNHAASFLIFAAVIFAPGASPSARAADEVPDDLVKMRAAFDKEVDFATRPIRDRYLSRLEALKRSIGSRGDARAALAVQEEIDRVKDLSAVATNVFLGYWIVRYDNGSVRKLSIDATDTVTLQEENGKAVSKVRGKIVQKGDDFLLDYGDGKIEHWKLTNGTLNIDHFAPKSTYPKGPPAARAVGAKKAN